MRSSRRDPVDTLPSPGDAFEVVILRQPGLPQGFEHADFLSLQNALVNGARASEAFNRQGLPLTARAQDVNAGIKGSTRCPKASDTAHAGNLRFAARFAIPDLPNSDKPRWESSVPYYLRISSNSHNPRWPLAVRTNRRRIKADSARSYTPIAVRIIANSARSGSGP